MADFWHHLIHPLPNAIMTGIMAVIVLYWLFVLLGGIGFGDADLGFDTDMDVDSGVDGHIHDVNHNTESDHDVPTEKVQSPFMKFLEFMNVGKVPFMLIFSTLKFFTWIGTLITTQFIAVEVWGWKSVLILIPLFGIGIVLTKFATTPMARFFKEIGYKGEEEIDFLGRSGKMLSTIKGDKMGFAEFFVEKNPMKLNVISMTGEELKYGDQVMVSDESDDKKIYYVTKEISI